VVPYFVLFFHGGPIATAQIHADGVEHGDSQGQAGGRPWLKVSRRVFLTWLVGRPKTIVWPI